MDEQALHEKLKASVGLSNEILSDQEESVARKLLHQAKENASSLNAEILRIRSALQALEKEYADEVEWVARLQVGVSPHKKVPAEVLGLIFAECVNFTFMIPPTPGSQHLVLSHVCSRWREVALADPTLWNNVTIEKTDRIRPDTFNEILSRAGHAIVISSIAAHILPPVVHVMHQYSDRYRALALNIDLSLTEQYLEVPFERLGNLEALLLWVRDISRDSEPKPLYPFISAFENASNLEALRIQSTVDDVTSDFGIPPSSNFPWSNLDYLDLSVLVPLDEFLPIFAQCTQLGFCEVVFDRNEGYGSFSMEPQVSSFNLAKLHTLKITSVGGNVNRLLDLLVAPSLKELRILYYPIMPDTFVRFIQRSECNIEILDMTVNPYFEPELERILCAIPRARQLILWGCTMRKTILDSIGTRALLPDINVLEGRFSSCSALRELLIKRGDPGPDVLEGVIHVVYAWVKQQHLTQDWHELEHSPPAGCCVDLRIG